MEDFNQTETVATPESTEKEEKKIKSSHRRVTRIIALFLAVLMTVQLAVMSASRVSFSSEDYAGSAQFRAADYLASTDEYLTATELQRMRNVVSMIGTPKTYSDFSLYASVAIADEDYEKALTYLETCIELFEGDEQGRSNLYVKQGCIYSLINEWGKAKQSFKKAIECKEDNDYAWLLNAEANLQTGNYTAALKNMEEYKKLQDLTVDQYLVIAAMQIEIGGYQDAVDTCTAALEMEGCDTVSLLKTRAQAYLLLDEVDKAREDAQRLRDEGGDEAGSQTVIALCQEVEGNYKGALRSYRKVIQEGNADVSIFEEAIQCAYLADDYEAMEELAQEGMALEVQGDTVNAAFYRWLGVAQVVLGKYEESEKNFTKYLEYDPEMAEIYYFRGLCYMGLGQYSAAIGDFSEAIDSETMIDESLYNRALCYSQLGNANAASVDFQKILDRNANEEVVAETKSLLGIKA